MSNVPVFVGLDYHQDSIQVCVLNQQGAVLMNRSAPNNAQQLGRIVQPLGVVQRVAIEACCGAADLGEELVEQLGWNVSLGHPAYIAKIKSSPDKTDYSDGRLLADLTRVGYLPRVWLAPAKIRELRQLVNHRQRLVDRGRAIKLQANNVDALMSRGKTLSDMGQYDRAIEDLDRAIKLEPNNVGALFSRGFAYYGKGQYDRAVENSPPRKSAPASVHRVTCNRKCEEGRL